MEPRNVSSKFLAAPAIDFKAGGVGKNEDKNAESNAAVSTFVKFPPVFQFNPLNGVNADNNIAKHKWSV